MKGLLVSLAAFGLFIIVSAVASHFLRLKRHLHLFAMVALVCVIAYFIIYNVTPANLYFLPSGRMCPSPIFDQTYGLVVFFLNCHSFVDCFFASAGGFSTSMLMAILRNDGRCITTSAMVAKYKSGTQTDRIYGWRIPYLESKGYIRKDAGNGSYGLTAKGRVVATAAFVAKRLMNLGQGG
jgi:hypothetical protein